MSSRVAYPFLTLSEAAVQASPWLTATGHGELTELTDFIPDWDYATSLRLRRSISIDRETASAELELAGDDMVLGVGLRVGTGTGRMPRAIIHHETRELPSASPLIEFDFEVPGEFLSSVLHLQTDIILLQSARSGGDLSPRRHGDRLWKDDARSRLEGEEPRFPIEVANFKHLLGTPLQPRRRGTCTGRRANGRGTSTVRSGCISTPNTRTLSAGLKVRTRKRSGT